MILELTYISRQSMLKTASASTFPSEIVDGIPVPVTVFPLCRAKWGRRCTSSRVGRCRWWAGPTTARCSPLWGRGAFLGRCRFWRLGEATGEQLMSSDEQFPKLLDVFYQNCIMFSPVVLLSNLMIRLTKYYWKFYFIVSSITKFCLF